MENILYQYQNGNTHITLLEDGTKIREFDESEFPVSEFPESIDVKISDYCNLGCQYCHESSTINGKHADLNKLLDVLSVLPKGTELALGGGNPLDHPDLISFLRELKSREIISNITINQGHLISYHNLIKQLIEEKLVYGIGISLTSNNWKGVDYIMSISSNIVFHIILGVHKHIILEELKNRYNNPKVLLLGYKKWGFGIQHHNKEIDNEIKRWNMYLPLYIHKMILSFDNLAIEQLELKRFFTKSGWDKFYMGDDFVHTMYIDGVKQEYAPTSRNGNRISFDTMRLLQYFKTR
jgi:organic radical activating enzyme